MSLASTRLLLAALLALLVACSSSSSPTTRAAGQGCGGGGDCAAGLSCLPFATFAADGGCSSGPNVCTVACSTDADCAALGGTFKCFAGCAGTKTCGNTG